MRALVTTALVAGLVGFGATSASAREQAPQDVCVMADKRVGELSGLVADGDRWYAVNDGGTKSTVYVLTKECRVERVINGPTDPFDVEDLARGADGTFWLADTGDNDKKRETVALISLTPDGKTKLHRLTYPDGAHDTEALLLDRSGTPYLITKNPFGRGDIYRPVAAITSPGPTALEKVGSVQLTSTDTKGGPVNPTIGSVVVTGAASNPDGTVVAVRTYTDAYLYAVPDGDLLAAFKSEPVRIPLPEEKQGEAIGLEPDGTLVSASEGVGQPIRAVAGAAGRLAPATPKAEEESRSGGQSAAAKSADGGGLDPLPAVGFTVIAIGGVLWFMHRRSAAR
ncbi:hypothetical protein [Actinokineospora xionganensis]|uniref:Esterase-like activity of phytase family protein n=1 Tax=Actinokineospora xionganensis TaxID=2684470 RepID=A0ABR7L5D4_9PSEU|nr:hypothetical protein [Actinokineospora xionganensis]MBC6447606.1 hypothetical protein [Actinokineospora xionganensis]